MHLQVSPYFIDGPASDLAYVNTRDHPRGADSKTFVESLWKRFYPYADSHFRQDARNHLLQRFWEMYLAVMLLDKGFKVSKHGHNGPEFWAQIDGRRVWFEAVAPTAGTGPDQVPELVAGEEATEVPDEQILLRFTNALAEKRKCYMDAVAKCIIAPEEP
jgi:type I restriction enzyme S subunit